MTYGMHWFCFAKCVKCFVYGGGKAQERRSMWEHVNRTRGYASSLKFLKSQGTIIFTCMTFIKQLSLYIAELF